MNLRLWFSNLCLDYKINSATRNAVYENQAFRQARANEIVYQARVQQLVKQRTLLNRLWHAPMPTLVKEQPKPVPAFSPLGPMRTRPTARREWDSSAPIYQTYGPTAVAGDVLRAPEPRQPEPRQPATMTGHGGTFDGGGATGNWDPGSGASSSRSSCSGSSSSSRSSCSGSSSSSDSSSSSSDSGSSSSCSSD